MPSTPVPDGYTVRKATLDDVAVVARQRRLMFGATQHLPDDELDDHRGSLTRLRRAGDAGRHIPRLGRRARRRRSLPAAAFRFGR